ncbi:hypothetical protein [Colwellia sp. PAMC 21821]|uniref:hypothetical protein n=1 Tax=Colwellia sp. PAMC 21821 TaxID=1816219 RepID=UPI0009BE9022|nr:hypothetical protein [Colwellia sp. PAMC 21821]ARD46408.1 hypothetical protein A3Q33_20255 [Colwellia sp. PAMC 21821]
MRITGNSVQQRKKCLAHLVVEHLIGLGEVAEVVENETNSEGHKDQVVIKSSLGIIHVTATESIDPNATIPIANYKDHNQNFLAGKDFVVFGWNTKDKRTMLIFVKATNLLGLISVSKPQIVKLKTKEYSVAITA